MTTREMPSPPVVMTGGEAKDQSGGRIELERSSDCDAFTGKPLTSVDRVEIQLRTVIAQLGRVPTVAETQLDVLASRLARFVADVTCKHPADSLQGSGGAVRRDSPETSHEAAQAQAPERLSRGRLLALATLVEHGPLTDHELARVTGREKDAIAPRRVDLVRCGFVCDSGTRRPTPSGHSAIVWTATDTGHDYLAGASTEALAEIR